MRKRSAAIPLRSNAAPSRPGTKSRSLVLALGFCLLFPVTLPAASAAQDIAKTIDRTGAASRGTATGTEVSPESRPRDPFPWLNRKPPRDPVFPEILIEPAQLLHQLPELAGC